MQSKPQSFAFSAWSSFLEESWKCLTFVHINIKPVLLSQLVSMKVIPPFKRSTKPTLMNTPGVHPHHVTTPPCVRLVTDATSLLSPRVDLGRLLYSKCSTSCPMCVCPEKTMTSSKVCCITSRIKLEGIKKLHEI